MNFFCNGYICNGYKGFLFIVTVCLGLAAGETVNAANNTDDIKLPFGIRHYDTGTAANFSLQDIDGTDFEFNSTKGHWVFLHFWASWCGPCRKEMPAIQKLANELQHENFQILMINTAEDENTIFTFLAEMNIELNSLMDVDGLVTEVWKPRGLPTTFLINPQGEVKYQAIGGREWNKPESVNFLKQLIEKP